jgi:SpoVK/Ycf46/Vps4 family AAA+-type ATPase
MEHIREITKIAEWGLRKDAVRVAAYLNQLIDKLEAEGDKKDVLRLKELLDASGSTVQTSGIGSRPRLPVDGESRLALADEEIPTEAGFPVVLDGGTSRRVEEFISFVKNSDELEAHGVGGSPSLITYGPPGTGKTQLARYIAGRLNMPLVVARADTLISSYLGSTSKNLRTLFDHVSARRCILFLDELDAFAKLRDDQQELGELKRVVVSLLQNLDNMNPQTVLLAATNHEHLLDPAIWRRFTFKIPLSPPGPNERDQMMRLFFGDYATNLDLSALSVLAETVTGSDIKTLAQDAIRDAVIRKQKTIDQERLIWRLIAIRIKRDVSPGDLTPEDLRAIQALNPVFFNGKRLAEMLNTSTATISRKLKTRSE